MTSTDIRELKDNLSRLSRYIRRLEARERIVITARVRRPFPIEPIRTLDAVHLATTEMVDEPPRLVVMVARDARVRENAEAFGYAVE